MIYVARSTRIPSNSGPPRCPKLAKVVASYSSKAESPLISWWQVARIVNYLHKHLVGKTLAKVKAQHDENVYGKVGCSAEAFEKALTGKKVVDAKQQGKYFW